MDEINEKDNIFVDQDPVLRKKKGFSAKTELKPQEYPKSFTQIPRRIIKSVSLYLQLLWKANPNGKTIEAFDILDILTNVKNLFGARYETKDIYVIRHIASDLREICLFNGFQIKKYFKNIDIERNDIQKRLNLSRLISGYFSTIVHFNYINGDNSYKKVKEINKEIVEIDSIREIEVPDKQQDYLKRDTFENIFECISIIFIMNYYEIFSEFLFDENE